MSTPVFSRGYPIAFAAQFQTAQGVPISTVGYTNLELFIAHPDCPSIAFELALVNAAQGTYSATLNATDSLPLGIFDIQASYTDALGVAQFSSLGTLSLVRSLKYG